MAKHWKIPVYDSERTRTLSRDLNVPPVVAQLLVNRGVEQSELARSFLAPSLAGLHDPSLLPGAAEAAERVAAAVGDGRRIMIYGDYDVDGVTGTSILLQALRLANADVRFYVPHRMEEGYGLNGQALRTIREEHKADLVITVDCGIASVEEARLARELGLELIITDHHEFAEQLPQADCIVHPRLPGSSYPFGGLCGAGVAFKLAWEIARKLEGVTKVSPRFKEYLLQVVSLAAMGTIADVVPLSDENRVLVRHGLISLHQRPSVGLRELLAVSDLADATKLESEDIAFRLAPRINAAGRLGQAGLAVELLTTSNTERARELARYLNGQNEQRQTVERRIFREAKELVEQEHDLERDRALVLGKPDWHPGVIGIVASRLVERYWRPVVLVALKDGTAQGSGRSIPGFDLHRALNACKEHLETFGGHQMAAGLRIDPDQLPSFRKAMCEYAAEHIEAADLVEQIKIDAEVPLGDVTKRLVDLLDQLAPFGAGNRRPLLMAARVTIDGQAKRVGGGERHLSFALRQHKGRSVRAIAFGMGERAEELESDREYDVAFSPQLNTFKGFTRVDLHVKDFRPCEL